MVDVNKYTGCFIGLVIGNAFGAPYEGGILERLLWKAIGKTKEGKLRYTDDTQMAINLASSFIRNGNINQDHLAKTFADSYQWSRGYGPGAAWLLKKIKHGANWQDVNQAKFKEGSYGNGAAMRAPILAMCYPNNIDELEESVIKSSEITHAHPLAIEGANLIALATYTALNDRNNDEILDALRTACKSKEFYTKIRRCTELLQTNDIHELEKQEKGLGNGVAASESCVTAIYFALRYRSKNYNTMLSQIYKLGGDTDTIGAMAGSIWGAFNGSNGFDSDCIQKVEGSENIIALAKQLHEVT